MSIITPGSLVFDIGANWGQSAQRYLDAGAGRVISVEPCVENFLVLQRLAAADARITPIMAAAWWVPALLEVRLASNSPGWTSVQPEKWVKAYPEARWGPPQRVPAITLGMLHTAFGQPDCVKIDVEGSEYEVLAGLGDSRPRLIVFEFHHQFPEDIERCLRLLEDHGYARATYTTDSLDLVTAPFLSFADFRKRLRDEQPKWGNITVS